MTWTAPEIHTVFLIMGKRERKRKATCDGGGTHVVAVEVGIHSIQRTQRMPADSTGAYVSALSAVDRVRFPTVDGHFPAINTVHKLHTYSTDGTWLPTAKHCSPMMPYARLVPRQWR